MLAGSELLSLGYVGAGADNVDDWRSFATGLLGMECVDATSGALAFRMDERRQRLFIENGRGAPVYGWEVPDGAALDRLAARLEAAGVTVSRASRARAAWCSAVCWRPPAQRGSFPCRPRPMRALFRRELRVRQTSD